MRTRTLFNQLAICNEQLANVSYTSCLATNIKSSPGLSYVLPIVYCQLPIVLPLSPLLLTWRCVRVGFCSFLLRLERLAFLLLL
jgi:hypothetical protein